MKLNTDQLKALGFVELPNGEFAKSKQGQKTTTAIRPAGDEPSAVAPRVTTDEERLNKTERRWLAVLRSRNFAWIGIQPITFKVGFDCRYSPDFVTVGAVEGNIIAWEVKGPFVFEKALYKPRAAANKFPFIHFMLAQWKDNQWTEKLIKP